MKLEKIEPVLEGRFLHRVNLHYRTDLGNEKVYEAITRHKDTTMENLSEMRPESVTIVAFNEDMTKVCVNREFRLAVNRHVYNFPAGFIDAGEDASTASIRELKEETNLNVKRILKVLPPVYNSIGISNEASYMVICVAEGTPIDTKEELEEIVPAWIDKEQAKEICEDVCTGRTQLFLYLWTHDIF